MFTHKGKNFSTIIEARPPSFGGRRPYEFLHRNGKNRRRIDFDFVYKEVASAYGERGDALVSPRVILRWTLLSVLYLIMCVPNGM